MLSRILHTPHRVSSTALRYSTSFRSGPSPPRLPDEEQREFEALQRASTGAFSTPRPAVVVNQASRPSPKQSQEPEPNRESSQPGPASVPTDEDVEVLNARISATGAGEELHPDVRRGAVPEFEGDRNPKTGEIGGPKNDPLRWGTSGEWTYNGRATDF